MKFQISRKEWLRGEGHLNSSLLRTRDNKMCCLGFLACAIGLTKEQISNVASPQHPHLQESYSKWPEGIMRSSGYVSEQTERLINYNDDWDLSEEMRETLLKNTFSSMNIEVEFVE